MKYPSLLVSIVSFVVALRPTHGFVQQRTLQCTGHATIHGNRHVRFANERDDFIPETSFGAEVVPEGQRPVNEYLEMRRSPLFEWASNQVGTNGVSS